MRVFAERILRWIARIWVALLLGSAPGLAEAAPQKMALVVGNAAYQHVPGLTTATADAQDVAQRLRDLGFEVTLLTDVQTDVFRVVLDTFAKQAKEADTVVFYYAGHAFQMGGVNHLVPVSATLDSPEAIRAQTWTLDEIAAQLRGGVGQVLIFLDACRTSPLPDAFRAEQGEGLAQYDGGAGTFVAFATRPGALAFDRTAGARNSPFTAALLARMDAPGQSISDLMIGVRNDVVEATGGQQVPWDQSSLRSQVYLVPEPGSPAQPATAPVAEATEPALPALDFATDSVVLLAPEQVLAAKTNSGIIRRVEGGDAMRLAAVASDGRGLATVVSPVTEAARIAGVEAVTRVPGVSPGSEGVAVSVGPPVPATERELHVAIQTELARTGCYARAIDGDWGRGSQAALERFYAARKIVPAQVAGGVLAPNEAAWRMLLDAPEKTCTPEPVAQTTPKKPSTGGTTKKKPVATTKKPAAVAAAPAPAPEKKGVKCKFLVVAVVCN